MLRHRTVYPRVLVWKKNSQLEQISQQAKEIGRDCHQSVVGKIPVHQDKSTAVPRKHKNSKEILRYNTGRPTDACKAKTNPASVSPAGGETDCTSWGQQHCNEPLPRFASANLCINSPVVYLCWWTQPWGQWAAGQCEFLQLIKRFESQLL